MVPPARKARPRFEFNRAWILRAIIVALAVALIALIVKVAGMAFGDVRSRTVRGERAVDAPPASARDGTMEPASPR